MPLLTCNRKKKKEEEEEKGQDGIQNHFHISLYSTKLERSLDTKQMSSLLSILQLLGPTYLQMS